MNPSNGDILELHHAGLGNHACLIGVVGLRLHRHRVFQVYWDLIERATTLSGGPDSCQYAPIVRADDNNSGRRHASRDRCLSKQCACCIICW
jgi:hypothetical protein